MSGYGTETVVTAPSTLRPGGWTWPQATGASVLAGIALGVLTNLAQGWLPGHWGHIANSGAIWSVVAFAAGAVLAGRVSSATAAVSGLCAEVGLVVGYYAYAEFGFGRDGMGALFWPLVWLVMACVAGPLFGFAAVWWRHGTAVWQPVVAIGALAGVFGQEGIYSAWRLHYVPQAWACLGIALLAPLLMARSHKERALSVLAAVVLSLVAYAAIQLPLSGLSA